MKKTIVFFFLALATCCMAAERTPEQAAQIAAQFTNDQPQLRKAHKVARTASNMKLVSTRTKLNSTAPAFYVFNQENNAGYVIVAGDDLAQDVLVYSESGQFDPENVNPNFKFWLNRMQEEMTIINEDNALPKTAVQVTAISPLLKNAAGEEIAWYQEEPYWNQCPMDLWYTSERCLTGCVATAAAQIMYKWRYPAQGTGSHSYTWECCKTYDETTWECTQSKTQKLSKDFSTVTFDWDNMLATYSSGKSGTTAQQNAVATLMYCCGVACEMSYGGETLGGSGALTDMIGKGLMDYFGYTVDYFITMYSKKNYGDCAMTNAKFSQTTANFQSYFNEDLEAGRPILMGGEDSDGGHEFVCDGRNSSGYFHINWGWEGDGNNYCLLSSLQPSESSYDFSSNLDALVGLRPAVTTEDTITWNADGVVNTTIVKGGSLTLPADPAKCESEKVFVGWTKATSVDPDGKGLVLAKNGDAVEGNETYYAVYAIEESEDAPIRKAGESTTSYTFTSKSWASTPADGWTGNADGYGYANNGIQFTSGNTNGNATSKTSYTNVSKVVVSYCTNAKNGAGTIDITVGSNAQTSLDVTKTGGTTARDLEFSYTTPQSGAITIGATCTTNSIYICGITIYSGSGKTYTNYSFSCVDCETKPEDIKTVTFNYNGNGQANTSFATNCSKASTILPTPNAWAKHNCTGWFDAAEGGNLVGEVGDEYTPSTDITLYAQWEEVPVTVYTVAEVKSEYDKGNIKDNDSIYVKGYITSIQLKPDNFRKYGSAIIWISDTEGESKDFELYNCYGLMGDTLATFDPHQESGTTQIEVNSVTDRGNIMYSLNDYIEAYGSFKLYTSKSSTIYELNSGCYITKGGKKIETDVENAVETSRPTKFIQNGMLIIEYNGTRYSITGEVIR